MTPLLQPTPYLKVVIKPANHLLTAVFKINSTLTFAIDK